MAISKETWDKAKFYFEVGKSISYISQETGISRGQISKKANQEKWKKGNKKKQLNADIVEYEIKNETFQKEKETLIHRLAELEDYEITLMNELVFEQTKKSTLVNSTAMLALIRTNQMLTKGKKQTIVKTKVYSDGRVVGEEPTIMDIDLDSQDIKNHVDAIDKASLTLGVNERHAKTQINNTNAQQNNEIVGYGVKAIED